MQQINSVRYTPLYSIILKVHMLNVFYLDILVQLKEKETTDNQQFFVYCSFKF